MKPLVRTGNSANIAFYRERDAKPTERYVWAEVLRNDFERKEPGGPIVAKRVPTFSLYVYEHIPNRRGRDVGRSNYAPAKKPKTYELPERTVTRLVRTFLEEGKQG